MRTPAGRCCFLTSSWTLLAIPIWILLAGAGRAAHAGVSVSPLQQEIEVKPGADADFTVTLANVRRSLSTPPARLKLEIVDFSVSLTGSISLGKDQPHSRSAVSWIKLDAKELVLEPEQTRLVKGRISAPRGADGDYWAALLVTPVEPLQENGVNIILRTASAVFVRVARRNYVERLTVKEVDVALPKFTPKAAPAVEVAVKQDDMSDDDRSLRIYADIENTGLVSLTALGRAHLYVDGRRKVASIPLHARSRRVLPGHSRRFLGVLPAPLQAGEYSLRIMFSTESQAGQKGYKEIKFKVDAATAQLWEESYRHAGTLQMQRGLDVNAKTLTLSVQPGRFTTATIPIANGGGGTMRVAGRLNADTIPQGWLSLDQATFTLEPRMRRSMLCRVDIPENAQPGEYAGGLVFEAEVASLADRPGTEVSTIPVRILVNR